VQPGAPGRFITLEGPEGAGKTVHALRLARAIEARGRTVILTREPGGTRLGDQLRAMLLEVGSRISPAADALLFNAARAQLVQEIIAPALEAGDVVLCARFADSTLAYQGYGQGVPLDRLREIGAFATRDLVPDLTVLLDVDPDVGIRRKADADRTRFETRFDLAFHRRVRAGFLELASAEPERFVVVDAARDVDLVYADVLTAALEVL